MTQKKNAARRLRADGELGEEEGLYDKPRELKEHYLKGIYAPTSDHFDKPWPTVRTETFVKMVFGSIEKHGEATQDDIQDDTGLSEDLVGIALADLTLWKKQVGHKLITEDVRVYFVKEATR